MSVWASEEVRRIAGGDSCEESFCGLVLVCSWPMPDAVRSQYETFKAKLIDTMPPEAYVYPFYSLHCTICTFRSFKAGPMDAAAKAAAVNLWEPVLAEARSADGWPKGPFQLRMCQPTFEGSAGIIQYEDADGVVASMRACLREAIIKAGGKAAEGNEDRSLGQALPGSPEWEPVPHLPCIVHSTVLRWKEEPSAEKKHLARESFESVASSWEPIDISVGCARGVFEGVFMHIPADEEHIWWQVEF